MKIVLGKKLFNAAYLPDIYDYSKRIQVFYGGAGSGKSVFVAQKLLLKALKDKRKVLVLRKIGRTVKNSVFQLLLDNLIDWKIADKCSINRTDFTITLPNGSQFLCGGLDDPEKIKSIVGITDAWMEEASEFTFDDFSQIGLRVRDPFAANQQIYLSFNPVSKANWTYLQFFSPDADKEFLDGVKIIKTNYLDNRFLPKEYVDSLLMLKKTNPAYYGIYALGEFGSLNKLVFDYWKVEPVDITQIDGTLLCGLDFGFVNDPTAFVCSLLDEKNKKLYVYQEFFQKGLLNDQIAKVIKEMGYAKSAIVADSAEQKSIEEIKKYGIYRIKPAVKGQGSILQGIQKLKQFEIIIDPSCVNLIEEFRNYSWKKDKNTSEYINEPEDSWNHGIDALRYSLQCGGVQLKTFDKKLLGI